MQLTTRIVSLFMTLRSQTLRLGILISSVIITAIIIFQLIWLNKVYHYEEKQFDHSIARTVRGLYEDIHVQIEPKYNLNDLIINPNSQSYYIKLESLPRTDSLAFFVQSELDDQNIFTDCYIGLYDSTVNRYIYTAYLPAATGQSSKENITLPESHKDINQLILYFPHRKQYILTLMNFWIISSLVLLIVLLLLSTSLYYFYRQKFLNETQKDFVDNFTHEFKTPVSVLSLAAEVLEQPGIAEKPEKLSRYASIVKQQAEHLKEQIEKLLTHAQSESHLLHLSKERFDLHQLIMDALNDLHPLIVIKNATLTLNLDATRYYLMADRAYLRIVLTNFIENALKYSKEPQITISTINNENGNIFISIKDNGIGIEKKHLRKIFEKFYRVPMGDQANVRGFGLGLAFSKKIIQSHHGKVYINSIPGVGSEFQIRLPFQLN